MPADANRLVWLDLEMTGLRPESDRILELALVVTDSALEPTGGSLVLAVRQSPEVLAAMDEWNRSTHARSGLIARVEASDLDEAAAEERALAFLAEWVPAGASPMCGNSICQDRRFLARWMPRLEAYFHYRNVDVSTIKELVRRWKPEAMKDVNRLKQGRHEALADVLETIEELRFYRRAVMSI